MPGGDGMKADDKKGLSMAEVAMLFALIGIVLWSAVDLFYRYCR